MSRTDRAWAVTFELGRGKRRAAILPTIASTKAQAIALWEGRHGHGMLKRTQERGSNLEVRRITITVDGATGEGNEE